MDERKLVEEAKKEEIWKKQKLAQNENQLTKELVITVYIVGYKSN